MQRILVRQKKAWCRVSSLQPLSPRRAGRNKRIVRREVELQVYFSLCLYLFISPCVKHPLYAEEEPTLYFVWVGQK